MPEVSVHIAVKDGEKYLSECLESILSQDVDLEVILINDGSTDSTEGIIQEYQNKDTRIKYFKNDENIGIAKSRAMLARATECEFIVPFDADDVMFEARLGEQLQLLKQNPDIAGVYGKTRFVDSNLEPLETVMGHAFSPFSFPFFNPIAHGSCMLRRENVLEAGNYQETGRGVRSVAVDFFLFMRMAAKSDFIFVNKLNYWRRMHDTQISNNKQENYLSCLKFIYESFLKRYDINEILNGDLQNYTKNEYLILMSILLATGQIRQEERVQVLLRSYQLAPGDYAILTEMGKYFMAANQFDQVLKCTDEILSIQPSQISHKITAFKLKTAALERLNQPGKAERIRKRHERAELEYRSA